MLEYLCTLIAKPDVGSPLAPLNVGGTIDDMALSLTSDAFEHNESIPSRFTCDGDNVSPPLTVQHIPEGTVSLVLIVEDPDVPTQIRPDGLWNHWVIFNIPPKEFTLGENEPPQGTRGKTTSGTLDYTGPCPPDREHRYFFKLYAIDTFLELPEGATRAQVDGELQGHIIGEATLMGRYARGTRQ